MSHFQAATMEKNMRFVQVTERNRLGEHRTRQQACDHNRYHTHALLRRAVGVGVSV